LRFVQAPDNTKSRVEWNFVVRVDSFAVFWLIFRFTSFSVAISLHRVSRNVMCAPSLSSRSPPHQTVLLADRKSVGVPCRPSSSHERERAHVVPREPDLRC